MSLHLVGTCNCGRIAMHDSNGPPFFVEDGSLHHPCACLEPAELARKLKDQLDKAEGRVKEVELGHSTTARHRDLVCNAARALVGELHLDGPSRIDRLAVLVEELEAAIRGDVLRQ